jgi:hypothetical protein
MTHTSRHAADAEGFVDLLKLSPDLPVVAEQARFC